MNKVVLDLVCIVSGKTWNLYTYDYNTEDGCFCGYLYALSFEHASYLLDEMKINAKLKGQMINANI